MNRAGWGTWGLLAMLAGCRVSGIRASADRVEVKDLALGYVPVGATAQGAIEVTSSTPAPVQIVSAVLAPGAPAGLRVRLANALAVPAGGTVGVAVDFTPAAAGTVDTEVTLGLDPGGSLAAHVTATAVTLDLAANPAAVDFGAVSLHARAARQVTLANGSPLPLSVQALVAGGVDFGLATADPVAVPANGSASVTLSFTPSSLGAQSASLALAPCSGCAAVEVPIHGTGVGAVVTVKPTSLSFGDVRVGQRATESVTVANAGNEPLSLSASASSGAPFSVSPAGAMEVPAGGSLTLAVSFAPPAAGAFADTLHLSTSDPGHPSIDVPLSGTGGSPAILVLPPALDFGDPPVASRVVRQLLIENVGDADPAVPPLEVQSLQLAGSAALSLSAPALPIQLAPGQSTVVSVTFAPGAAGAIQGSLDVSSNDPVEPAVTVPIDGAGRNPAACRWTAAPSPLDFGLLEPGQPITLEVGIQDVGADDCVISAIDTPPGGPFSVPGGPIGPVTLGPGWVYDVAVRFAPTSPGETLGTLDFTVSDPQAPVGQVPLVGGAAVGCLKMSPASLDFGPSGIACPPATKEVTLQNACAAPLTVDSVQVTGLSAADFSIGTASFPATLPPGASLPVPISFAPSPNEPDQEPDGAALSIDDGEGQPRTVGLFGLALQQPSQEDDFTQQAAPKVDVLMVIDNSGSFGGQLQAMHDNADAFLQAALASGVDFHLGVTTTGIEPATGSWTTCPGGANGGEAGRLFPVDDSSPRILTPQTPNVVGVLANNVEVGTCHWDERPFDAAVFALTPPLSTSAKAPGTPWPNDGNLGFQRPDALLNLIFIQDDDDESVVPPGYTIRSWVDHYVKILRGLKGPGNEWEITASAVTAVQGCNHPADLGVRYFQLVGEMGGTILSVCTTDWGGTLGQLAAQAFSLRLRFPLSKVPQSAGAITVTVAGVPVAATGPSGQANWTYDPTTGDVIFSPGSAPPAGSKIAIDYPIACP